jgi:hypothetical protein
LKQNRKIIYAAFSFVPVIIWFLFPILSPVIEPDAQTQGLFTFWDLYPGIFGKITMFAIMSGFAFAMFLSLKVFRNNFVPEEKKKKWVLLLVAGNIIILPLFWFLYIREKPENAITK